MSLLTITLPPDGPQRRAVEHLLAHSALADVPGISPQENAIRVQSAYLSSGERILWDVAESLTWAKRVMLADLAHLDEDNYRVIIAALVIAWGLDAAA